MSFIQKEDNTTVNIKLTDYARKKIAEGELNYTYFVVGDSEIDYQTLSNTNYNLSNTNVLLPFEKNSPIKNPIKRNTTTETFLNNLPVVTINEKTVVNEAKERGFFTVSGITAEVDQITINQQEETNPNIVGIYISDEYIISQGLNFFTMDVLGCGSPGQHKFEILKFDSNLNEYVVVATSSEDDSITDNYGGINYTRTQDGSFFDGYNNSYPNGYPLDVFNTVDGTDSTAPIIDVNNAHFFLNRPDSAPNRIAQYQLDTGDTTTLTPNRQQRVWAEVSGGDRIRFRVSSFGSSNNTLSWNVTIVSQNIFQYRCPGETEYQTTIPNCQTITLDTSLVKTSGTFVYTSSGNEITNVTNVNNLDVGDLIFIPFSQSDIYTGSTAPEVFDGTIPFETKWFKILEINGSSVTLDRDFSETATVFDASNLTYYAYPGNDAINNYYGSGDTTPYWNDASLNFTSVVNQPIDVPVWNLSMVYGQELLGKGTSTQLVTFDEFKSKDYLGFKNFINLYENKYIGIVHYSNNTISNFYGEGFYQNTAKISMPHLMYHRRKEMGINIVCESTERNLTLSDNSSIKYYNLIVEGFGDLYVGKCFPSLKIFVIEDLEILTAMSYKSNRSYTLPNIDVTLLNSTLTNSLTLNSQQNIFVTYHFSSTVNSTGVPYQKIIKYSSSDILQRFGNNNAIISVSFDTQNELEFLNENYFLNGEGYHADKFEILVQVTTKDEPDSDKWKLINVSGVTKSVGGGTVLDVNKLVTESFNIGKLELSAATDFDLNSYIQLPLKSDTVQLNFADEEFFFGNVSSQIEAKVYESIFICSLGRNEFIKSNNVTWDESLDYVFISEVGIYDSNSNLVGIGKLTKPIRKKTIDKLILYLTLDF